MASFVYHSGKEKIADGSVLLESHSLKVALLKTTHTPDQANHTVLSDVSGDECSGGGYTAGGFALGNPAVTRSVGTVKFDADDVQMALLSPNFRYAVIYDTQASNALICLMDPGSEQTPAGNNVRLVWNASGIFTLVDA